MPTKTKAPMKIYVLCLAVFVYNGYNAPAYIFDEKADKKDSG